MWCGVVPETFHANCMGILVIYFQSVSAIIQFHFLEKVLNMKYLMKPQKCLPEE
jgi:hypothetical protein